MRSTAERSPVRYSPVAGSSRGASYRRERSAGPSNLRRTPRAGQVGKIVVILAHHAPLDRALARIAGEQGRPRRPTLPDMFDTRRGFGQRKIVVDQDRRTATRVGAPNSPPVFKAGVERRRLATIGNSLVFKREPDPRGMGEPDPNGNEPAMAQTLTVEAS